MAYFSLSLSVWTHSTTFFLKATQIFFAFTVRFPQEFQIHTSSIYILFIHLCCTLYKSDMALVPKEINSSVHFPNFHNEFPGVMWLQQAEIQPQVINKFRAVLICSRKEAN